MGKELSAKHYTGKGYLLPGKFELYKPLYYAVAALLPSPEECPKIVDLGCGVGYFAKILYEKGYSKYLGIDFSDEILKHAMKNAPYYEYKSLNLYAKETGKIFRKHKIFTAIETLEHIEKDIYVLKKLPKKSIIVGSVPSKLSAGHVRCFKGISDVTDRYEAIIDFNYLGNITLLPKSSLITIFKGEIK